MPTTESLNGESLNGGYFGGPAGGVRIRPPRVVHTQDARAEIDQLMGELHLLISHSPSSGRAAIDEALPAVARLQVATANVDACNPSRHPRVAAALTTLADQHVRSMRDAFERGLGYTSDSTMRRLLDRT